MRLAVLTLISLACSTEPTVWSVNVAGNVVWEVPHHEGRGRVVATSDMVYFPGEFHDVIAVNKATGKVAWRSVTDIQSPETIGWGVAVGGDLVVFADVYLHAFDRNTGVLRWKFTGGQDVFPAQAVPVANDAMVFSGSTAGFVFGIRAADGTEVWRADPPWNDHYFAMDPTLAGDTLFVGYAAASPGWRGGVAAYEATTGTLLWSRDFSPLVEPGEAARCLGNVVIDSTSAYATTEVGDVVALDRHTGEIRWHRPRIGGNRGTHRELVLVGDVLIASSFDSNWEAIDSHSGNLLWSGGPNLGSILSPPATDGDLLYVVTSGGGLATLDPEDGSSSDVLSGRGYTILNLYGTPAVDSDHVYIGGKSLWAVKK